MDGTHATVAWTRTRQSSATTFPLSKFLSGPFGPRFFFFFWRYGTKAVTLLRLFLCVCVVSEIRGELYSLL